MSLHVVFEMLSIVSSMPGGLPGTGVTGDCKKSVKQICMVLIISLIC